MEMRGPLDDIHHQTIVQKMLNTDKKPNTWVFQNSNRMWEKQSTEAKVSQLVYLTPGTWGTWQLIPGTWWRRPSAKLQETLGKRGTLTMPPMAHDAQLKWRVLGFNRRLRYGRPWLEACSGKWITLLCLFVVCWQIYISWVGQSSTEPCDVFFCMLTNVNKLSWSINYGTLPCLFLYVDKAGSGKQLVQVRKSERESTCSWSPNSTDLYFWYIFVNKQIEKTQQCNLLEFKLGNDIKLISKAVFLPLKTLKFNAFEHKIYLCYIHSKEMKRIILI